MGQTLTRRLRVIGQVMPQELAVLVVGHVARVTAELDAAPGVIGRREQQVLVRCDVPVPRGGQLEAAAAAGADAREQEAGLALIIERERQPRQVEDGQVLERHGGIAGDAYVLAVVEGERAGADLPGFLGGRAGAECHILKAQDATGGEIHDLREAVRLPLQQLELRIPEAGAAAGRIAGVIARDMDQRILVIHLALHLHAIVGGLVFGVLGFHDAIALAHGDVAGQGAVAIHSVDDRVAEQIDGAARGETRLVDRRDLLPRPRARCRAGKGRIRLGPGRHPAAHQDARHPRVQVPPLGKSASWELVGVRHGVAHYNEDLCLTPTSVSI